MKTRIVQSWNTDKNRGSDPYRYSCQAESKFLFWKYWKELDWFYYVDSATEFIQNWRLQNSPITKKGIINIINYPEYRE